MERPSSSTSGGQSGGRDLWKCEDCGGCGDGEIEESLESDGETREEEEEEEGEVEAGVVEEVVPAC